MTGTPPPADDAPDSAPEAARLAALTVCRRIGADPAGPIGQRLVSACARLAADLLNQTVQATAAWVGQGAPADPLRRLFDEATNRETYFFRDRAQLLLLRDLLTERNSKERPSVWSAGCATGEEAYSVAILAAQVPALAGLSVLGSDLSGAAVAAAAEAAYRTGPMSPCRSVTAEDESFLPLIAEQRRQVMADIRARVRFLEHNILSGPPQGAPFDAVLCRNVMIYMDRTARNDCMAVLDAALKPGGVLLIGPGDAAPAADIAARGFRTVFRNRAMAFVKESADAR
jgi:chemotaxis protein methyltransferase CheR